MPAKDNWCLVTDVFGYSLKKGATVVALSTAILSAVVLLTAVTYIHSPSYGELTYNTSPVNAINLIFAMVCCSTSAYELIISFALLLFLHFKSPIKYAFLLTLWFVSNVNLLAIFFGLVLARTIIYWTAKRYIQSIFTMFFGIVYEAVFIYFCVVVNSYGSSMDPHLTYYY